MAKKPYWQTICESTAELTKACVCDVVVITEKLDENLVASEVEEHQAMAQVWID
ncbi:hypothetical protein OK016_19075 [Vibrio chagasii]|nr:hypothetical protein [Vibrio chagasii]